MKKIILLISIALALGAAPAVFAASYNCNSISNGFSFKCATDVPNGTYYFDSPHITIGWSRYFEGGFSNSYWGEPNIALVSGDTYSFTMTYGGFGVANTRDIDIATDDSQTLNYFGTTNSSGVLTLRTTLTPPAPPPPPAPSGGGAFLTVPTGTAGEYTAVVGQQFADPGTLEIVGLAVGIPLFFVIVDLLIGLFRFQKETDKDFKRISDKWK